MGYIYKITNNINNKIYIGKTTRDPWLRFYEHINACENLDSGLLHRAMHKYGIENFSFEIIDECDDLLLNDKEVYYIQLYNSYVGFNNSHGYNCTLGGDGASKINELEIIDLWKQDYCVREIVKKIHSSHNTVKNVLIKYYGNQIIEEIHIRGIKSNRKAKILGVSQYAPNGDFIAHYESITQAEAQNNYRNISRAISECKMAGGYYWISDNSNITIEEIISKPYGADFKCKRVNQYDLQGNFIGSYKSIKEAKEKTGASKIGEVCRGKRNSSGGYYWQFDR